MSEEMVDPDWAAAVAEFAELGQAARELLPGALRVADLIIGCFANGGRVATFGNGGSAADAAHLTGELIGHYRADRRPLPSITLGADGVVATCIANDYSFDDLFARQVRAVLGSGDVAVAFSTSGRSPNIVRGLVAAREAGAVTVLLAGRDGGPASEHADHRILVPSDSTPRIQEVHTLMLHLISDRIDRWATSTEAS